MQDAVIDWARVETLFPHMREVSQQNRIEMRAAAQLQFLGGDTLVIGEGEVCRAVPLVLEGVIRVSKVAENGREIVLYRVGPGETCIMSLTCLMADMAYDAVAVVEEPARLLMIDRTSFARWVSEEEHWRRFAFRLMASRLQEVMTLVEEVAFGRMDERLARFLLQRSAGTAGGGVVMTHEEIAAELGTSREVVSRLLKDMERTGVLALNRGRVGILDPAGLAKCAGPSLPSGVG